MNVTLQNLVKDYGNFRALNGVNLQIGGGMFGLLGPNGAGKTTLMRILTTLIPPTSGSVQIGPYDLTREPGEIRQILGYMPQDFGFYRGLNAHELLDYIGAMKNIPRKERVKQIETVLSEVNLTGVAKRRVGGYSGGMRQRLGIAQALLGDPKLVIVDEPTAGLDPEERIRFRNLLTRLSGDRTVLLSTHIVGDIEASCAQVAVLNQGQLIFFGTPEALTARAEGRVWELEIAQREWETIENRYRIIASRSTPRGLVVRLISPENPEGRGSQIAPGLEDGYMAVMSAVSATVEKPEAQYA